MNKARKRLRQRCPRCGSACDGWMCGREHKQKKGGIYGREEKRSA